MQQIEQYLLYLCGMAPDAVVLGGKVGVQGDVAGQVPLKRFNPLAQRRNQVKRLSVNVLLPAVIANLLDESGGSVGGLQGL